MANIKTPGSHQMRGLTFMIRREQGWQLKIVSDVWSVVADEFGNQTQVCNEPENPHLGSALELPMCLPVVLTDIYPDI